MKIALLALALVGSLAAAQGTPRTKCPTGSTEFVLLRNLYVETVTCKSYFARFDFDQIGTVTGEGCSITGALPSTAPGVLGKVTVAFQMADGQRIDLTGCRIDGTTVMSTDFVTLAINCTQS